MENYIVSVNKNPANSRSVRNTFRKTEASTSLHGGGKRTHLEQHKDLETGHEEHRRGAQSGERQCPGSLLQQGLRGRSYLHLLALLDSRRGWSEDGDGPIGRRHADDARHARQAMLPDLGRHQEELRRELVVPGTWSSRRRRARPAGRDCGPRQDDRAQPHRRLSLVPRVDSCVSARARVRRVILIVVTGISCTVSCVRASLQSRIHELEFTGCVWNHACN